MSALLRWPTEDPRNVLVGRVVLEAELWQVTFIRPQDGPLNGSMTQVTAGEPLREGALVQVRAGVATLLPED